VVAEGATEAVGGTDGVSVDVLTGGGEGFVGVEFVTCDAVCIGERVLETVLTRSTLGVEFVTCDAVCIGEGVLETVLTRSTRGFAKLVFVGCASGADRRIV
jgi:hypothetical protein